MNKIKTIKTRLKKINEYKQYKKTFKNKQMRFLLSKLDLLFNSNESNTDLLVNVESKIYKNSSIELCWIDIINELSKNWLNEFKNIKWNEFGSYLFYIYHYSEYHKKKSNLKNIYSQDNFVEIDEIKRKHFNNWIKTMYESINPKYNFYIMKVLELIK